MLAQFSRTVFRLYRAKPSPKSIYLYAPPISSIARRRFLCSNAEPVRPGKPSWTKETSLSDEVIAERVSSKYVDLSEDVIKELTQEDPTLLKKLKLIQFEYEVARQDGKRVPSGFTVEGWKELLAVSSFSGRQNYMIFRFKVEMTKIKQLKKKDEERLRRVKENAQAAASGDQQRSVYSLGQNCICLRLYDSYIDNFFNSRVLRASMMMEQPLTFDFGFHSKMTRSEQKNAVKQITYAMSFNREHKQLVFSYFLITIYQLSHSYFFIQRPFPIQFCNVDYDSDMFKDFTKFFPNFENPDFPINVSIYYEFSFFFFYI